MSYRKLSEQERASLQQGGNFCTDWDGLYVKEGFDPAYVRNCRFSGTVYLGNFKSQHELPGGFTVHSGIYNAALNDVTVGDDVLIYNVSGYISRYDIGDRVIIFDCGNIYTREGSVFGCGTEVSVLDETGGKTVRIFPGMSSSYAWLAVFERDAAFQNALDSMVSSVTASVKSDRGRIGNDTLLASAMTVDSVDIADNVTVDGAAKLRNGMIESGCTIGYGVIMEHFILSKLSKVKGGSKVMSSFVGETAIIDSHYCAKDSLIFSNWPWSSSACKKLRKSHEKAICELIHIRDNPAHHFSVRMPVNVFERKHLNLPKRLISYVLYDLVSHLIVAHIHQPLRKRGDQGADPDPDHDPDRSRQIHLPGTDNIVDRVSGKLRDI